MIDEKCFLENSPPSPLHATIAADLFCKLTAFSQLVADTGLCLGPSAPPVNGILAEAEISAGRKVARKTAAFYLAIAVNALPEVPLHPTHLFACNQIVSLS